MRAKNTAALANCHEHRNPCSFLRLRAEIMRICQYKRLAIFLIQQTDNRRPTPSDGKSNGGICPTYDAECGKVPSMVVVCDRKQNSDIKSMSLKRTKGDPENKHTDNQFHPEHSRYTSRYPCSATYLTHTRTKPGLQQLQHMAVQSATEPEHSLGETYY